VESRADGSLLGFVGLGAHPAAPGDVEIGWRLVRAAWGRGIATEAALAVRDLAFDDLALPRLVSVAQPENAASLAVMRRIGMRHWRDVEVEAHGGQPATIWVMGPADRR
jgi:RimJ/RimL family protein N-acetyltransferase